MDIKKANLDDVDGIYSLIEKNARIGKMLYRTKDELAYRIRDFFVCENDAEEVLGCCGLRIWTKKASEIYSLAVHCDYQHNGIGSDIIKTCIGEAKSLKSSFIYTFTFNHEFFEKGGFEKVNLSKLPRKIFTEKTINREKVMGLKLI
jgi:amino-acid N-acetyltransferase